MKRKHPMKRVGLRRASKAKALPEYFENPPQSGPVYMLDGRGGMWRIDSKTRLPPDAQARLEAVRAVYAPRPPRKPQALASRKPIRRSSKPLRKQGARSRREAGALRAFREAVLARGACERCGESREALESHYLVNRARGVGWPGLHDPSLNGCCLDRACHEAMTRDPRWSGPYVPHSVVLNRRIAAAFSAFEAWRAGRSK